LAEVAEAERLLVVAEVPAVSKAGLLLYPLLPSRLRSAVEAVEVHGLPFKGATEVVPLHLDLLLPVDWVLRLTEMVDKGELPNLGQEEQAGREPVVEMVHPVVVVVEVLQLVLLEVPIV
jgi:hypothetical protein